MMICTGVELQVPVNDPDGKTTTAPAGVTPPSVLGEKSAGRAEDTTEIVREATVD